ncbi:MAG TPA: hypothetical protein VLS25_00735 [Dehalococcoidia bacterium]|nr:hypothetical protein [Dehalococcoidia bacterium]
MTRIRKAWLLLGPVAVAGLALGGFGVAPAGAAVNSINIIPAVQTVAPGATGITVSLEVAATPPGIGTYDIDIVFDQTLLRADECTSNDAGFCNFSGPGVVTFSGKSAGGLTGSPLQLGSITFEAADTGGTSPIDVSVVHLADPDETGIAFAQPAGGEVIIQQPLKQGDVDCNNSANSVDALFLLRFGAGLAVAQHQPCPNIGTMLTLAGVFGDVDCSGAVNSVDALKILRFGAGLPVAQNEPPPCVDLGQLP